MLRSSKLSDVFETAYFLNVCYRTYHWLPSPCITAGLRHVYWDRIMVITWVHQCQPKYLHFVCQYYAHVIMNICPPASVCVCMWLPAHRPTCEHLGELRLELRHAPLGQSRLHNWGEGHHPDLGLQRHCGQARLTISRPAKSHCPKFFLIPPIFDFLTDQKNILQFRLIREGFDIKDMKNLHSPLRSGNERRFQFEVTPHIILSWRNSDIGMWATWDLSMFISCPKNWNKNLHEHMSFSRDSSQGWLPVPGQNFGHCL